MILIIVGVVYLLHICMRLSWEMTGVVGLFFLLMLPFHFSFWKQEKQQEQRLTEVCAYLDSLLYAFLREGKIVRAVEAVESALPDGGMKAAVQSALDKMETYDQEEGSYEAVLKRIEENYDCRRVKNAHDYLIHVECYGGEMEQGIQLLIKDKNRWQERVTDAMRERRGMFREIVMSIGASLFICSAVLYLPVMQVNISESLGCQLAGVFMIFLDELVLLWAQKCMKVDWINFEESESKGQMEFKLQEFRMIQEKKGNRFSYMLLVGSGICFLYQIWMANERRAVFCLAFGMLLMFQQQAGFLIAKRKLVKEIQNAFPRWIMDILLLLQSENVYMALVKSLKHVPSLLKQEVEDLIARLEMNPEGMMPYHEFLKEFEIPEVQRAMGILYSLSIGNCGNEQKQIEELVDRNMVLLDRVDKERIKNKNAGMYLLFLAPVGLASMKLLVDMAVFLKVFLSINWM